MRKANRRRQAEPWDLFHPAPRRPLWEELPPPVQRRTVELLARLLHEQRHGVVCLERGQEVDHE